MTSPIKVLFVASSFPRFDGDTASVFLLNLARALIPLGCEVRVVAPDADGPASATLAGIPVSRFRYFPKRLQTLAYGSGILPNVRERPWRAAQIPSFVATMYRALRREIAGFQPDLVHAHWLLPQGLIAAHARRGAVPRIVVTAHGGDAFALRNTALKHLKFRTLRIADAWTSNTRATAEAVIGKDPPVGIPLPAIIPMGVDVARFAAGRRHVLRDSNSVAPDTRIVLFVGRLVEKKGVDDLIRAFADSSKAAKPSCRLWIVGDGSERPALERLTRQLGIAEQTRFFGMVRNDALPDFLAAADLFVGPSVVAGSGDTEGMGVVFIEAFASGLCVLATNTGGIAEVVEDGVTGVLVEPRNHKQLAGAMVTLLANDEYRHKLAAQAARLARERYDWDRVAVRFHQLYLETLGAERR